MLSNWENGESWEGCNRDKSSLYVYQKIMMLSNWENGETCGDSDNRAKSLSVQLSIKTGNQRIGAYWAWEARWGTRRLRCNYGRTPSGSPATRRAGRRRSSPRSGGDAAEPGSPKRPRHSPLPCPAPGPRPAASDADPTATLQQPAPPGRQRHLPTPKHIFQYIIESLSEVDTFRSCS